MSSRAQGVEAPGHAMPSSGHSWEEAHRRAESLWDRHPDRLYLNFAGHASRPKTVVRAVERALEFLVHPERMATDELLGIGTRTRAGLARLLGARPDDVFLTTGASTGIAHTALALGWRREDEVLYSRTDFPAHYASWKPMAARHGFQLTDVGAHGVWPTAAEVVARIRSRTRVVSLSHVRFDDGARLDTSPIAHACRQHDALLLLDVSQSLGVVPLDVTALGADIVVGAGFKYLLGPWGAGFCWLGPRARERMRPMPRAWFAQGTSRFDQLSYIEPALGESSVGLDASETATVTNLNLAAFSAAIETVEALGVDFLRSHVGALTSQLLAETDGRIDWITPRDLEDRGPFLCFRGKGPAGIRATYERLTKERVTVSLRNERIRIAPHLMHTPDDMQRLAQLLNERSTT